MIIRGVESHSVKAYAATKAFSNTEERQLQALLTCDLAAVRRDTIKIDVRHHHVLGKSHVYLRASERIF